MTQEKIESIKEKMCGNYCKWQGMPVQRVLYDICNKCPLNELEASAEPEIIRCKDCKWCVEHYDTDGNVPYWICKNWDAGTDADGFCYEAERKIDE